MLTVNVAVGVGDAIATVWYRKLLYKVTILSQRNDKDWMKAVIVDPSVYRTSQR